MERKFVERVIIQLGSREGEGLSGLCAPLGGLVPRGGDAAVGAVAGDSGGGVLSSARSALGGARPFGAFPYPGEDDGKRRCLLGGAGSGRAALAARGLRGG